jgi:hypothetical protein
VPSSGLGWVSGNGQERLATCSKLRSSGRRATRTRPPSRPTQPFPARARQTPASVASSVEVVQSPRWPMRNMRPFILLKPVPRDRSKRWWISRRSTSPRSYHTGEDRRVQRLVGALRRQAPGPHRGLGPAPVPREDRGQAMREDHVERLRKAVQQVGVGRIGPVAVGTHLDDLVPAPEGARQPRAAAARQRLGRQGVPQPTH